MPYGGSRKIRLHPPGQVLPPRQTRHHLERVPEDQPVRPVHLVAVELDGLRILQLRVAEQPATRFLPPQRPQHRLDGNPLVHVERDRIHLEPRPLPLPGPLQPRLAPPQRLGELPRFLPGQRPLPRLPEERRQRVLPLRLRRRPKRRWQVRVELVPMRRLLPNLPVRLDPRRRQVLPLRPMRQRPHPLAPPHPRGRLRRHDWESYQRPGDSPLAGGRRTDPAGETPPERLRPAGPLQGGSYGGDRGSSDAQREVSRCACFEQRLRRTKV